jgi:hypothetical protein
MDEFCGIRYTVWDKTGASTHPVTIYCCPVVVLRGKLAFKHRELQSVSRYAKTLLKGLEQRSFIVCMHTVVFDHKLRDFLCCK